MSMKGRAFAAAIGATAMLSAGAVSAQEAGDMVLGAGWLGFYPQDSSKPLTFTSPVNREVPGSGSAVSNSLLFTGCRTMSGTARGCADIATT